MPQELNTLTGNVERITFYNEENNYTVAKLKTEAGKLVTIVGNLPSLYIGEGLTLKGKWVQHKDYGSQFEVSDWICEAPKTLAGIERFLASGLLKGVGPVTAARMVKEFGLETLEVIAASPEQLVRLPGMSLVKADRVSKSLQEHTAIQNFMVFLQGVGVSPGYALKIYRTYQDDALQIVKENPYRLADEVLGIGFKIADQIARKIGINPDSPYRIQAGIRFLLNENANAGHVYAVEPDFLSAVARELEVGELQVVAEVEGLLLKKELFREKGEDTSLLYLAPYYYSEVGVVAKLGELLRSNLKPVNIDAAKLVHDFAEANQLTLAPMQRDAILKSLQSGIIIITGGPGTGKTTLVKAIIHLCKAAKLRVMLAAPTGRAAKRLAEATGETAKTIHRLLGYGNETAHGSRFLFNEEEPLATDVLIVDEFSMVDLLLFYNLLKAAAPGTRIILVGDVDQLPPVGPGSVLRDLLASQRLPMVCLNVIFRQAKESLIITNAHKINKGEFPILAKDQDFFFIEEQVPEDIVAILPGLVKERIPHYTGCDPVEEIQVLTPMRRTVTGVDNLNRSLQLALNPPSGDRVELTFGANCFRIGDKVMQIRNDYQKFVFNGDIGRVREIDLEDRSLVVAYQEVEGERLVPYEVEELDQLVLAYAISVHKSQGNEYPVVVMPVTTQHFLMLQRNLLYTAVTRAKKMVVLIGTKKAVAIAVKNNRIEARHSLLKRRLQAELPA